MILNFLLILIDFLYLFNAILSFFEIFLEAGRDTALHL